MMDRLSPPHVGHSSGVSISSPNQALARNGASVSSGLSRLRWFGPERYLERVDHATTFGTARAVQMDLH